jgi:hypothetical protein
MLPVRFNRICFIQNGIQKMRQVLLNTIVKQLFNRLFVAINTEMLPRVLYNFKIVAISIGIMSVEPLPCCSSKNKIIAIHIKV